MFKKEIKLLNLFSFIIIYIIISLFIKTNQENSNNDKNHLYLQLFNNKINFTDKNDIHFYNDNFEREILSKITEIENLGIYDNITEKISIAQFSSNNGGYILILIMNVLYIFDKNKNFLNVIHLKIATKKFKYSLIPNKKENNYLYFIISYYYFDTIILYNCKYDLTLNEIRINGKFIRKGYFDLKAFNCIFINFLSSLNKKRNILTCFFFMRDKLFSRAFEINYYFKEILSLKSETNIKISSFSSFNLNLITNENKTKALIYFLSRGKPFWLTFDFKNKFSDIFLEQFDDNLRIKNHKHKKFYFNETDEYIIVFPINNFCKKFIMIFNNKFKLKNKLILSYNNCSSSDLYNIFFDGNNYQTINSEVYNTLLSETYFVLNDKKRNLDVIPNSENYLGKIKCKTSTEESAAYNLCTSCNNDEQYFQSESSFDSIIPDGFVECYNNETKPLNFYFDSDDKMYKLCFETCQTCEKGGDGEENNCLTCDVNHIKKPGYENTTNCVTECFYSFYYTPYGYYKCSNTSNCPKEASLYVREIKKCTDDCRKEEKYKYQYGGQCYENCPKFTSANENNICLDININSCSLTQNEIDLKSFLDGGGVDINAKTYAKEFGYTNKHVSLFYNSIYSIILYKDLNCIDELKINIPKVDFGICYSKLQNNVSSDDKIIIALVEKTNGNGQKKSVSYFFYHPETGEKLDSEILCKDEKIIIKENIISQLNESDSNLDIDTVLQLTRQNIDIFNLSNEFYTDICYHFDSPNGKDVPFKDRIHYYYPNLTLCHQGCVTKGVNFSSMESICECKIDDIMNNEFVSGNALIQNALGEVADLISSSNLLVLTCYKDIFKKEFIIKGVGGFIMIGIFIFEFTFVLIFWIRDIKYIRKYLFNLTQYYTIYISDKNTLNSIKNNNFLTSKENIKTAPPKKIRKGKKENNLEIYPKKLSRNLEYSNSLKIQNGESESKLMKNSKYSKQSTKVAGFNFDLDEIQKRKNSALIKAKANCGNMDIEEYLKPDFDEMEFDDAIKADKRDFCQFFSDVLKEKQIIMETFFYKENLKPISIKVLLLFLNINLYFVINGLFFNENYIIKLYESTEEEEFFSYFPRSISNFIYATLVGFIIGIIIDCIFIEEKKIKRIFLREKNDIMQIKYEISQNVKSIKKRYIIFIFLCLFICILSWYYVSGFNVVYPGVQIEWIKSSVTIIIIMQILSVLARFLEAILREISFKCKSEKIYKVKKLIS